MTFFDCTADLVGQLNGNGQKGMLQIDAPPALSKISGYATGPSVTSRLSIKTDERIVYRFFSTEAFLTLCYKEFMYLLTIRLLSYRFCYIPWNFATTRRSRQRIFNLGQYW